MNPPNFVQVCNYLPFEENLAFYLNNLELRLPRDDFYQVWLKLACWFWRRFFLNVSVFLLFCYYLPLERGDPLYLNNLESLSLQDDLCQVWLKLAKWFWRRSRKFISLLTNGQTDGQRAIRKFTWAFYSGKLKPILLWFFFRSLPIDLSF